MVMKEVTMKILYLHNRLSLYKRIKSMKESGGYE